MNSGANSLYPLLRPDTVAVIGAAREPHKIGHQVVRNLIEGGFPKERIFPINPYAEHILGLKCYPSILDVPTKVDLSVIVVPARIVPKVLEECGKKGVKAVAIISSGFKEVGNVELEEKIVRIAKKYNMRLLGPNIVGVCDTIKSVNASFCQSLPLRGNIAFITQSGALGIALVGWTKMHNIGLSDLVSLGNMADVDQSDLIEFFGDDPETKVITLYIEGVKDGRKFFETCKRVTVKKPILAIKAGKAERTVRAIKSHTGSLAGSDSAYNAVFKQSGVIRVPTFPDLFDWAVALSISPKPLNNNIVILTNGGGAGVMATDAAEEYGISLLEMPKDLADRIRKYMPPFGSVLNPIDLTGMAGREWYRESLKELLRDSRVGGVIVLYCHTAITTPREIADAIIEAVRTVGYCKPVVVSLIGGEEVIDECERLISNKIPCYDSPEKAMAAMGAIIKYYSDREKILSRKYPRLNVDYEKAKGIIEKALKRGHKILSPREAAEIVEAYGIPVVSKKLAKSKEEAIRFAEEIGYPLVMEVDSPHILHKTDVGGIIVGVNSREEVGKAYDDIIRNVSEKAPEAHINGIIVRKMAEKGREVILGMHRDPIFGPVIMFGSGGILVELLKDVSFRVVPLSVEDAHEIIEETKAYKMLKGYRGEKEADIDCVIDAVLRLLKVVEDFSEIEDVDINPFFVYDKGKGGIAVDVKIILS